MFLSSSSSSGLRTNQGARRRQRSAASAVWSAAVCRPVAFWGLHSHSGCPPHPSVNNDMEKNHQAKQGYHKIYSETPILSHSLYLAKAVWKEGWPLDRVHLHANTRRKGRGCSQAGWVSTRHTADAGSIPWCSKRFFPPESTFSADSLTVSAQPPCTITCRHLCTH